VPLHPDAPWAAKHLETLRHFYARSPFATPLLDTLAPLLDADARRLVDVTIPLLRMLATRLGLATPLVVSSEAGLEARYRAEFPGDPGPTQRIIAFSKALGATELLEGESGRSYLDVELCRAHGIEVTFHHYAHPVYQQPHTPFISHLSAVDLLLSCGEDEARRVLASVP
jgi:hypothetical protein